MAPAGSGRIENVGCILFYAAESFAPDEIKLNSGLNIPKTVVGNLTSSAFRDEVSNVIAADALALWRFNTKGLAIEVQVESPGSSVAVSIIEGELLRKIAMWFGGIAVAKPILAGNGHVQQR